MTAGHSMESMQQAIRADLESHPLSGGSAAGILRRRFGFGPSVRPIKMLDSVMAANPEKIADLGDGARSEAARWWLTRAVRRALRPDGFADVATILAQLDSLPDAALALFPSHLKPTLAALAERGHPLPVPQGGLLTANSLLVTGALVDLIHDTGDSHE